MTYVWASLVARASLVAQLLKEFTCNVEDLSWEGCLKEDMATHSTILAWRIPMNSIKRQKVRTLKDELFRSVGAQYVTGDQWRNNSRRNEETEPKQKQHSVVTGNGSKVQCCKEQYCIGTWKVGSMNQSKLEMVKQMTRMNVDILEIAN